MSLKHYIIKLFVSYLYIFNITNFGAVFVFAALKEEKKMKRNIVSQDILAPERKLVVQALVY